MKSMPTMVMRQLIPFVPALLILSACDVSGGPDWHLRRGVITNFDDSLSLQVPDTIRSGQPATLRVWTHGDRCVLPAYTDQHLTATVLTVEPYDSVLVGDVNCPSAPCLCSHDVTVLFAQPGDVTLRVVGLGNDSAMATRERTLVIH